MDNLIFTRTEPTTKPPPARLELDDDVTVKSNVVEEQVDVEVGATNDQVMLITDECEAIVAPTSCGKICPGWPRYR